MIINCEFIIHSDGYDCKVTNQLIPANVDKLIFQGDHAIGKSSEDVNCLFFLNCAIPQIPHCIGDTFKNIEKLYINNSNLNSITKYDLKQFQNLKVLNFYNNNIEFLPADVFEFTKHIKKMRFNGKKGRTY